ncbi:MAG: histidine triad nucleotide-binding protein [Oscillospiraceae bacterium]|nr:histidine triad nucleotide-binding protein [Oscillospiraceae bacterium]
MDCIFCKIIKGEIPSKKVYEDENVLAFHDINPRAKTHIVVIPKEHIESAAAIDAQNACAAANVFTAIPKIARELGLENYRIINNCGEGAGQTVFHIHFHLLGGDLRDF